MTAARDPVMLDRLEQRFPDAVFEVQPSTNGSGFTVFWDDATPDNDQVANFLRSAGFLVASNANVPGYVRAQYPHSRTRRKTTPRRSSSRHKKTNRQSDHRKSGSQSLWSISNLDTIRQISAHWVNSLTNPGTVAFYAAGMALLVIAAGYLSWALDIRPSLIFGQHLADAMVTEWFDPRMIAVMVLLLSITPNLLEFFAVGLAASGHVIVDIAIKVAIIFDAATDAPMAFSISKAIVSFFIQEASPGGEILAVLVSVPVLLSSTIVIEILFLSFVITLGLLIRRSIAVRRFRPVTGRSYGQRSVRR